MTGELQNPTYPQYCFHLSPTIEKWCRFRAREIHGLTSYRGFEGQDLYFHLNHPIKWVQIAGVVVAIDEYPGRRIYTVDDSSGATIECKLSVPKNDANLAAISATAAEGNARGVTVKDSKATATTAQTTTRDEVKPVVDGDIDVGDVLLVKGNITVFRHSKQVVVYKILHLRCTEDEVQFWEKMAEFHDSVLSKPWCLSEKEVQRCRREATRSGGGTTKEHRKHVRVKRKAGAAGLAKTIVPRKERLQRPSNGDGLSQAKATGLERNTTRVRPVETKLTGKRITVDGGHTGLESTSRPNTRMRQSAVDESVSANANAETMVMERTLKNVDRYTTGLETSIPRARVVSTASDRSYFPKARATGFGRNTQPVSGVCTSVERRSTQQTSRTVSPKQEARGSSKTKVMELDKTSQRIEVYGTGSSNITTSNTAPPFSDRGTFGRTRLTGLERGIQAVIARSPRESRTGIALPPPSRKARVSGLERKSKRVKTVHVEEQHSALDI